MKRFLKQIIFLIITIMLFIPRVNAASNPYPKYQESPFGGNIISCTWYAWQQAHDRMGVDLPLWTYVQKWYSKAEKAGYAVGKTPKANSIMVWDYGEGFGGHAAYVTAVDGETITFDEGGSPMTSDGIYTGNQFTMSDMESFLVGFIYLDVPRKVEEKKSNTNTNITKTEKPKPVVKSSDNSLKELSIDGLDIGFVVDKLEYQIEVEYELTEIKINAIANDTKATVVGNSNYPLVVGENNFVIKVTAEDSSVREYKIYIIRKEKVKVIEEEKEEIKESENSNQKTTKENKNTKRNNIILISAGISLFIILAVGIIAYKKTK